MLRLVRCRRLLGLVAVFSFCVFIITLMQVTVFAVKLPQDLSQKYDANRIYLYNPCNSGVNSNSSTQSSSCVGTLDGKTNEEKVWNYLVQANIDGVSNNPAVIAGIMGNFQQESDFNPFLVGGSRPYYGIFQTEEYNLTMVDNAGLGQYWGSSSAPEEAQKQAIELELDWLLHQHQRFLGTGEWNGKGFMTFVKDVSANTPEAYSDLFLVTVEDAYTDDAVSPHMGVSNELEEKVAKEFSQKMYKRVRYYQEAEQRRKYARQIYDKYSSSGVCLGGGGGAFSGKEVTWQDLNALSSTNEKLKLLVSTYGEYSMQLQKYYGIPWELPFAIMVFESQLGDDTASVAYMVKQQGYFNLMGLTDPVPGSFTEDKYRVRNVGDNGCFRNATYKECHVGYESISKMMLGYAIYHGRSGFNGDSSYDGGLKMLSPKNYRLNDAIEKLMATYCYGGCYWGKIINMIRPGGDNGGWDGILSVMKEKGWMNSEELAKAWNIQPGGIVTQKWGWGDIRKQIWDAYGEAGLPANESSGATSVSTGNGGSSSKKSSSETSKNSSGSNKSSSGSGTDAAVTGNAVLHKPTNDWLDKAGLQGYNKDEVAIGGANGAHIDDSAQDNGQYANYASDAGNGTGLPGFIILHLTSASNFDARSWTNYCGPEMGLGFYCPPHFTIDVKKREIFQHFPLSHPSAAVSSRGSMSPDRYGIQIEIVGHGGDPGGGDNDPYSTCMAGSCTSDHDFKNFTDDDYQYIVTLLKAISAETGIPLRSTVTWAKNAREAEGLKIQSDDELKKYIGVLGHTHINGKWDPLNIWDYILKALGNSDYVYSTSAVSNSINCPGGSSSDSGGGYGGGSGAPVTGHCFAISDGDGGCTEDGFTWFGQGGDSWAGNWYGYSHCGDTFVNSGCGPSAFAMVATALTNTLITPPEVAEVAIEVGARVCGSGTDVDIMSSKVGPRFGLKSEHVDQSQVTVENVNRWLDEGKMMIFSTGCEYSTEFGTIGSCNGHVVAIRGRASDGKWYLFDSARRDEDRLNRHYRPEEIISAFVAHGRNNFNLIYK